MTKPKRKQKRDDSNNTTSSQSSIEPIMIKPVYTNLNDEEKKGIMELDEEEKKYVIFLSADLVFVRVPLPRCSTDAFNYLFPFLFFRSRARRLNAGEQRLFEVDEKFIQFPTLIETSSFGVDTQAKVLGISTGMIKKAWKFFGYRKLSSGTTRFLNSGEHGFDENIMERLGFNKEDHVTVLVWYALLDDKTKKKVNNKAAIAKRNREKAKQEMVENEKGEKMTKEQLRNQVYYEKRKQRNKEFIRKQFISRPPGYLQKEKCSICGREKSFGWVKSPDACWYVEKLFKEKGLTEYPSFRKANGYLTKKKRKYLGEEDILLRTTDILCYACWKNCEGAGERTMQKLLKL